MKLRNKLAQQPLQNRSAHLLEVVEAAVTCPYHEQNQGHKILRHLRLHGVINLAHLQLLLAQSQDLEAFMFLVNSTSASFMQVLLCAAAYPSGHPQQKACTQAHPRKPWCGTVVSSYKRTQLCVFCREAL